MFYSKVYYQLEYFSTKVINGLKLYKLAALQIYLMGDCVLRVSYLPFTSRELFYILKIFYW